MAWAAPAPLGTGGKGWDRRTDFEISAQSQIFHWIFASCFPVYFPAALQAVSGVPFRVRLAMPMAVRRLFLNDPNHMCL